MHVHIKKQMGVVRQWLYGPSYLEKETVEIKKMDIPRSFKQFVREHLLQSFWTKYFIRLTFFVCALEIRVGDKRKSLKNLEFYLLFCLQR